jgi:hypothetical protein
VRSEEDASGYDHGCCASYGCGLLGANFRKISAYVIHGSSRFDLKETPGYNEFIKQNGCTLLTLSSKTLHRRTQDVRFRWHPHKSRRRRGHFLEAACFP